MHTHDQTEDDSELQELRTRNSILAVRLRLTRKGSSKEMAALLNEIAMLKSAFYLIWALTDLDCEPQDHDKVVEYVAKAIAAYKTSLPE